MSKHLSLSWTTGPDPTHSKMLPNSFQQLHADQSLHWTTNDTFFLPLPLSYQPAWKFTLFVSSLCPHAPDNPPHFFQTLLSSPTLMAPVFCTTKHGNLSSTIWNCQNECQLLESGTMFVPLLFLQQCIWRMNL